MTESMIGHHTDQEGTSAVSGVIVDALGDRYEILSELGEGSFGSVYRARDKTLNRIVAVKSVRLDMSPDSSIQADLRKRFLREAQVAAQLRHTNIVMIHDIASTPRASLIIMEFVDGVTLRSILQSEKRLALPETIALISQVAAALDYAHAQKIVHRDIKPANIMITASDEVRVTDFGIAKTDTSSDLTVDGAIIGTPDYMAPEQAKGEEVDGRSDLFSLGCVLYECLSGELPFRSGSVTGVLLKIASDDPPPDYDWSSLGLPPGLRKILSTAMAKDREKRYPSGAALIGDLRALHGEEPVQVTVEPKLPERAPAKKPSEPAHFTVLREEERPLCLSSSTEELLEDLNLSPDEAFIISRVDGQARAGDILDVSPFPDKQTARTLLSLIEIGLIKLQDAPAEADESSESQEDSETTERNPADDDAIKEIHQLYESSKQQNYAQILEVGEDADLDELERAFKDKLVRYNPEAWSHIADVDFQRELRQLMKSAYDAFMTLCRKIEEERHAAANQAPPRPEESPTPSISEKPVTQADERVVAPVEVVARQQEEHHRHAEEVFERAEKAYLEEDFWQTIQLCRHAIELCDTEGRYHHLLGLALAKNENWKKEAEESLRRATELSPTNPEYFQVLGDLYQSQGLEARAQRMFDMVEALT
jgi:serine/threonine protein kinase